MLDEFYMKQALEKAEEGLENGEVPVGCIFVAGGQVISSSHNLTNQT